jgi:hypothetical protein
MEEQEELRARRAVTEPSASNVIHTTDTLLTLGLFDFREYYQKAVVVDLQKSPSA